MELWVVLFLFSLASPVFGNYDPSWESLDRRPLPEWYDKGKIGIFLHWGLFSVPSYGSEWFWYHWKDNQTGKEANFINKNYKPGFTYQEFAPMFTAEFFDPHKWAELFKKSGAKYVVLTSKHHEGFTMFPSKRSFSWNSMDVGPHRDIVGELSTAVKKKGLVFGVYHSLYEWYNPIYLEDKRTNFTTRDYVETKLWPDLKQLVNDYEPSIIWSDGDWETYDTYWKSTDFIAWLYNESPVKDHVVVNDRWGKGTYCHHGDFYNCEDKFNPGKLQDHKWENAFTLDKKSWGYRRNIDLSETMTMEEVIKEIVSTVSCGGNALINVGPTKEGTIAPIFQERLLSLGKWLNINGQALYETSPWEHQLDSKDNNTWYTCRKTTYDGSKPTAKPSKTDVITDIYAIVLKWPVHNILYLNELAPYLHDNISDIKILGNEDLVINWKISNGMAAILLPDKARVRSEYAWVFRVVKKEKT